MSYYPIFLELDGRRCLVIGGGSVAEGKVQGLLAAGANVTVLAPQLTPALRAKHQEGSISYEERAYREGDLAGFELCFVATDDRAVNEQVAAEGKRRGVWVNAADDPANCDFILPSVVRRGNVVLAVSTGGASPAMARRLREELEIYLGEDIAPLTELLSEVRAELRAKGIGVEPERWQQAVDARLRALIAQSRMEEARSHLLSGLGVPVPGAAAAGR